MELLVGTILFTIVTGIAFSLLMSAQLRYQGESTVTEAFQQANVALDQIVRDVHSAGYPPMSSLSAAVATSNPDWYALPFAWTPNYPTTPCTVGGTCTVPGVGGHHPDACHEAKSKVSGSRDLHELIFGAVS